MAIARLLMLAEDFLTPAYRMFGKATKPPIPMLPFDADDPGALIAGIDNPSTRAMGIARMKKLNYGAFYNEDSRRLGALAAERELVGSGKGFGGAIFGRPMKGLSVAHSHIHSNFGPLGLGIGALAGIAGAVTAPKHHKMSAFVAGATDTLAFGAIDIAATALGGPILGFALGSVLGPKIGHVIGHGVQMFNDANRNIRHLNMGGDYKDTEIAYTMRQRAAQEMAGSIMNARRYLGQEALLMHQ